MATINEKMTAIADAIRAKTGGTELLGLDAMAAAIAGIKGGGVGELEHEVISGSFTPASDITSGTYYVDTGIPGGSFGEEGYNIMYDSHYFMFLDLPEQKTSPSSGFYSYEFLFGAKFGNLTNYTYPNGSEATNYTMYAWRNSSATNFLNASTAENNFYIMQHPETGNIAIRILPNSGQNQLRAGKNYTWMMVKRDFR